MAKKLRMLVIGAHPDDCDLLAGGLAGLYVRDGHAVKFLSVTNGDTGHHVIGGGQLARRRHAETQASAKVLGIEYEVFDNHCGELMATIENRKEIIRRIRLFKPDLVLTHPPDDYHPDHRNTSLLVQDSAYVVTVPGMCALTPHLRRNPIYGYACASMTRAASFSPEILVDIGAVVAKKMRMACCHESQFCEWIPYNQRRESNVPKAPKARRLWLKRRLHARFAETANHWRSKLIELYGEERGNAITYAEAIQTCPFGSPMDADAIRRLFGFTRT